jgi:serine protein kinase
VRRRDSLEGMSERDVGSAPVDIGSIAQNVERGFKSSRRVLSFAEYLELLATDPVRYTRDASRYLRDVFDHFGTRKVQHPWGDFTRWNLFDVPWESDVKGAVQRGGLVGQEHVQEEMYRALSNFAREGRPNRLVLLHGPNGSAKSTFVACLMGALEQYSLVDEGALYRYSWVFPSTKTMRGSLGFTQKDAPADPAHSYAHLTDDQIDAKLLIEVRDHPLFLPARRQTAQRLIRPATGFYAASSRTRANRYSRLFSQATAVLIRKY